MYKCCFVLVEVCFSLDIRIQFLLYMASSNSTPSSSHSSSDIMSMQIITTKLNGSNYLLWAQAMKVALGGRK